jgi:hypothetical protein
VASFSPVDLLISNLILLPPLNLIHVRRGLHKTLYTVQKSFLPAYSLQKKLIPISFCREPLDEKIADTFGTSSTKQQTLVTKKVAKKKQN